MSDNQDHKYTLYYFDAKGRAEPVRVLFAVAGVPFDDVRIDFKNWASFKKQTPMGQLPYLDVDDGKLQLCQSRAIMRYLAKTFGNGLAGKTKSDAAKCDMYVDGCVDLLEKGIPWLLETNEEKKKELWKTFSKTHLDPFLDRYERFLHKNPSGFFVGDEMTWADVMIFTTMAGIEQQQPGIFKHHEEFHDFITRMKGMKTIKRYIRDNW